MKKMLFFTVGLSLFLVSCRQAPGISGTFTGLSNDTLWITVYTLNEDHLFVTEKRDTVVVNDGRIMYDPQTTVLTELRISPLDNIVRRPHSDIVSYGPGAVITLLYAPGERIRLDAHSENEVVSFRAAGNSYNEAFSLLNVRAQEANKQLNAALKMISDPSFTGDKAVYQEQLRQAMQVLNSSVPDYIRQHPDDPFSAYLAASFDEESKLIQYTDSLGSGALESEMGEVLRQKTALFHSLKLRREEDRLTTEKQKESIGQPAPEFTLKDIHGNDFSLSSLRGKYVVLDFWGSWCGWCLEAFPDIKKYYADHSGEFEIVGVNWSDTDKGWRLASERHSLPWVNVRENPDKPFLHEQYRITVAPSYVLIDKAGRIASFPEGHRGVFQLLDSLRDQGLL